MKKHLTRFLPLTREVSEAKPCSAFARVQDHVQELRRFFELPDDELFLDEFYCALHKRILLQGRMYIFEHYLCFYSNVFGWVKQKVIPLHQVKEITKKRNYGFPNSVEVIWKKKEFFTSFLNRNDAYELLCDAVKHVQESPSASNEEFEGMTKESEATSSNSSSSSHSTSRQSRGRSPKKHNKSVSEPGDEDSDLDVNDDEIDVWSVISGPAPAIPENMELLCEDSYDVSVQEFFSRSLSMESMFLDNYHKRRGDTRYRISEWEQLHGISGFVRQATFVSPVKGVRGISLISPKTTECNQDHRLCIYQGDHLVFQISQVMKDIPYGDNFSVEIRWDVKPKDGSSCQIAIYVAVPFIRSVLAPFRSLIESNVKKEMQESVKLMTEMLKDTNSTNPETEAPDPEPSEIGEAIDSQPRSAQVLARLQNLLGQEEGIQKLEQLIGSTELLAGMPTASTEIPQPNNIPMHQTTTTMNIQSPPFVSSFSWILFFCCLFMLVCQVMLVLLWTMLPPSPHGMLSMHEPLDGFLEQPIKQLHEMEETLISVVQMLNATLSEVKTMHQTESLS